MINCGALTVYAYPGVMVTIDNIPVVGVWEGDDVVQVERNTDLGTSMTGADGASVVSISADQSANLTLKLQPNSAMNQYLAQRAKLARSGSPNTMQVAIRDTSTGEGGGCSAALVVKEPSITYGENASEREWVIFCSCWQPSDITYAPVAAGG